MLGIQAHDKFKAAETADTALRPLTRSCLENSGDANCANCGRIQPSAFTLQSRVIGENE